MLDPALGWRLCIAPLFRLQQILLDNRPDILSDFINGLRGVDHLAPLGVFMGKCEKCVAAVFVNGEIFPLEAVCRFSFRAAFVGAGTGRFRRADQE